MLGSVFVLALMLQIHMQHNVSDKREINVKNLLDINFNFVIINHDK